MVIWPRCAEFFEFELQNLSRDLERTCRGNPGHASICFCFFAHLPPIFSSHDFLRGSQVEVKSNKKEGCPGMLRRVHSKPRVKIAGPNSQNLAQRDDYMKVPLTWVEMDRYVHSKVQEESSAAILVQVQHIYSHKLPSRKTAPVERPRDTTAICLLLCKEHSSVSVHVLVRGAAVDFRPPPVLCRMVIASPGSFALWGV